MLTEPAKIEILSCYKSLMGEGKNACKPVVIVRVARCNLHCKYPPNGFCDTWKLMQSKPFEVLSVEQIVKRVQQIATASECMVLITGGEPLIYPEVVPLILALRKKKYFVEMETNGSINIPIELLNTKRYSISCITLDIKTPSSEMDQQMVFGNLAMLRKCDQLKFVCADSKDLGFAFDTIQQFLPECTILFSPVFSQMSYQKLAQWLLIQKIPNSRMSLQLHKIIWPDRDDDDPNEV